MDAVEQLRRLIREEIKRGVPVQTVWAEAGQADLQSGTMDATSEGLEYFDVLLGLGGDLVEPEPGSKVLLGILGNKAEACILLYAEQTAKRHINGSENGGLVLAEEVAKELNTIKAQINQLKGLLQSWVPVPSDGGAALKTVITTWSAQQVASTVSANIQNKRVSHGG